MIHETFTFSDDAEQRKKWANNTKATFQNIFLRPTLHWNTTHERNVALVTAARIQFGQFVLIVPVKKKKAEN